MKKISVLLLAGLTCLSLTACGSSGSSSTAASSATESTAEASSTETSAAESTVESSAEETAATESASATDMETVTADESLFTGTWVEFNAGFKIYVPSDWQELELTDEMKEQNIAYAAQNEDGSLAVSVGSMDTGLGADATIEQLASSLENGGRWTLVKYYKVNGLNCIGVKDENNYVGYAFLDQQGVAYIVVSGPITDTDSQTIVCGITNSITPTA